MKNVFESIRLEDVLIIEYVDSKLFAEEVLHMYHVKCDCFLSFLYEISKGLKHGVGKERQLLVRVRGGGIDFGSSPESQLALSVHFLGPF